jgi:acyl-coenzyme A thioesterase PaaI-like protein
MRPSDDHMERLALMYERAPINALYRPLISLAPSQARIAMDAAPQFWHAAGALHGSFYFKGLDDAAWFAAATMEPKYFLVTTAFTTYITRPMSSGRMTIRGQMVSSNRTQFIAEAVAFDADDHEVARASGILVRSKVELASVPAYNRASGPAPDTL